MTTEYIPAWVIGCIAVVIAAYCLVRWRVKKDNEYFEAMFASLILGGVLVAIAVAFGADAVTNRSINETLSREYGIDNVEVDTKTYVKFTKNDVQCTATLVRIYGREELIIASETVLCDNSEVNALVVKKPS